MKGVARTLCRAQRGLDAPLVHVEVDLGPGLPTFSIVGLPAAAVRESRERVRASLSRCGYEMPAGRITVNLGPGDIPKEGARFDLPIAVGVLAASGQLRLARPLDGLEFYGELSLTGELMPVRGVLLAVAHAERAGRRCVVPEGNAAEARLAAQAAVAAFQHLSGVCAWLEGEAEAEAEVEAGAFAEPAAPAGLPPPAAASVASAGEAPDLADVRGHAHAKRALVIAAAGFHSLLMLGPPGSGKSMLAQRLPGLLPPLDRGEAIEVATLLSLSGRSLEARDWGRRPFRAPHHTASAHAIVGGGPQARPGEISLAHCGVLFLDELPEFDRRVLEALREPLESGRINVSRASCEAQYPAAFLLVAAMNPCPCGYAGDASGRCRCKPVRVETYLRRISGPLLDRIDLRIEVPQVDHDELMLATDSPRADCTAHAAARVRAARDRQLARAGRLNAHLGTRQLETACGMTPSAATLLAATRRRLSLSGRSCHRIMRVSRTIADLAGSERVDAAHIAEAIQLRRAIDQ